MWPKDAERIAEEKAGVSRPAPATLASTHLAQALDALDDACSPEAIFAPRKIWPLQASDSVSARRTLAETTQRNYCATATLFTAFAAEAFVNDFLAAHDLRSKVSSNQFRRIDRGSTTGKYIDGVALAYEPLFGENDEVMPAITELFKVRSQLVHARPGVGPPLAYLPDPTWRTMYPVAKIADWLVAVAGAAELMEMRCYGFDYQSLPADFIWHGRQIVSDIAAQSDPLPNPNMTGRAPLIQLLADAARERSTQSKDIKLTVNEIRDARVAHAAEVGAWDTFTKLLGHPPEPA